MAKKVAVITMSLEEIKNEISVNEKKMETARLELLDLLNANADNNQIVKARASLKEAVDLQNDLNTQKIYSEYYQKSNPVLAAAAHGEMYKLQFTEKETNVSGKWSVEIVSRKDKNAIDLWDFDARHNGKGSFFPNGQWPAMVKSLNLAIKRNVARGLELSEEDQREVNEKIAKAKAEGKWMCRFFQNASTKNGAADLQEIIDCILFVPDPALKKHSEKSVDEKSTGKKAASEKSADEKSANEKKNSVKAPAYKNKAQSENLYQVTSADFNYLDYRKTKHGHGALDTATATADQMTRYIYNVLYHMVSGNPYTVDKKEKN